MTQFIKASSGLWVQRNSDGSGQNIPAGIIQQVSQQFSISKVAGASTVTIGHVPRFAASISSLVWSAVEHLFAQDHGQGMQSSEVFSLDNPVGLNRCLIPTEQGSQTNGNNTHKCEANSIFVGVSAGADRAYTVTDAAEWFDPDGTTAPLPYNTRKLSGFVRSRDITIGDGGAQVVRVRQVLTVPTRADVQALRFRFVAPLSIYSPSATFTRMFTVDCANGTTTTEVFPVLNGAFLTNTTQPYILASADLTKSIGVYTPLSAIGELGYFGARSATNFLYCFYYDAHDYGAGPTLPAGDLTNDSWACFGALTDTAASMRTLYLAHP